jgi:hypothetical protein
MSNSSLSTASTKPMIFAFVENKPDALFVGFSQKLRKKHPSVYRVNIAKNIKDVKYSILIYFNNKIDYTEFQAITDEIISHFDGNLNVFYKSKEEPYGTKYTYSNINQVVVKPDVEKQKIAFIPDDNDDDFIKSILNNDVKDVNIDMPTSKIINLKPSKTNRKMKVLPV